MSSIFNEYLQVVKNNIIDCQSIASLTVMNYHFSDINHYEFVIVLVLQLSNEFRVDMSWNKTACLITLRYSVLIYDAQQKLLCCDENKF